MDPGTTESRGEPTSAPAPAQAPAAGITKVAVVPNPPPVASPRRVGFDVDGKGAGSEAGGSAQGDRGAGDGAGAGGAGDERGVLTADDINAILGVHGYASVDEAAVIDLHETGARSTTPLAVFANAQIMFLHSNAITDLSDLWKLTCLVKLDLAHNLIEQLPSAEHMGCLVNLKLLYLHNNAIQDWDHVGSLAAVPQLTMLTMHHNPLAEHPKFRHYVVNKVPQLQALDSHLVADEERMGHEEGTTPQPHPAPFTALSEPLEVPPPQYHPSASPDLHLKAMKIELRHLIKLKKKRSPVVTVQRVMRASVDRRWVRRRRQMGMWAAVRIQSASRYARWRRGMLHSIDKFLLEVEPRLVISYQDNERTRAAWIIQLWWKKVKPDPHLYRAAVLIAKLLRRRVAGVQCARQWLKAHGCLSIVFDPSHRQRVLTAAAVAWRATHNDIRKVPDWWLARKRDVEAGVADMEREERRARAASRQRKASRGSTASGGRSPWAKSPKSFRSSPRSRQRSPSSARSGRRTPKHRGTRLGAASALASAGVMLGAGLPALSAWNLRYPGDYGCPAVDGAAEEAMEGDIRFAMYFVENRVRRTALQCFVQPQPHAPDRVMFRRRPDAARYLALHGEKQLGASPPAKPYRPVSESLRQANYRRYRLLKRRVTRTPKADIHAFQATVARVDMDVGRMVGSRRAAPPANTRHFATGLSPEDVAAAEAAKAAAAAAARGDSDCDSDDGLDPYTAELRAQQTEGQEEARRRVAREAKEKREASRTLMVVTLPTVELCLRTLVALRATQFREDPSRRSRLLLPGYFATVLHGGVIGVGQHATRDAAAIAIQSTWRSFHLRQTVQPPLHLRLARQRGAVLMQRVFRMRHLRWRLQLLSAVARLSYGIDSEYLYLEESVYRVLLDSSLWGRDRQEGSKSHDTTGHANPGGARRPSQQLEEELWEAVGATEAVAVTKARPRHPVEQWVATGSGQGKGKGKGVQSPTSRGDTSVVSGASPPSMDADSRPVRPKSGGRVMGFRAAGITNVLTKGTTPRPPVVRDPAKDGQARLSTTVPGRPAPGLPPRPWRHPYVPEHELEVCVISGRLRLVQPRRPSEKWLGRRVGLPLWLGWGVDWVKAPATRPNRPYSAVVPGLHTKAYKFDNVALLTEGVDIAPVSGKLTNPAFRDYDSRLGSRGATTRHGKTHASYELDPPDWTSRGVRLLEMRFQSVQEARVRACVLLARTWHPYSRCGATMYSHSQVDSAWRRGKAGMPGKSVAAYPLPDVPDVDVPALPTRWALRFAWSDWEVIKLPKHLQVPLSSRRPASPNGPASSPSPVDSRMAGSASASAQQSYPVTPMPDESQTTPRMPPPAQLYSGGAVPQAAVRGGVGPQGSVHVPHMAPVKPGPATSHHGSARSRGPSPIREGMGSMYPTQPSSKPPPRASQSFTRRRSFTQHPAVTGGMPPVTIVREGDPSLRRPVATAPSPVRDTQFQRSQSFNTHRTRKHAGNDAAISQQAWRPFQTGRTVQSAMGAAANAHVHELRKMTKLNLRRKRAQEVEVARRRVQSARAESRNKRHAANIDRTLQRRKEEQLRLKSKLDVAQQLEAADGAQEDERDVRAAIVRERRMRQKKRREDRVFSSGFAASQNLVTRHLAAGLRRRKAKEDRGQVLAKRREFDRVKAARQRYRELSQQVTDEEKRHNVQRMKMTVEQGLQQRRQQELMEQHLARENVLQARQMTQLHRAFRDTANAAGMRAAMTQGAAGPLELAVLSARHNYMVSEGRPLSAPHAPPHPAPRHGSDAPGAGAGITRAPSFTGSVSDMGDMVPDLGDDYELVDGIDPFGAMGLGSPSAAVARARHAYAGAEGGDDAAPPAGQGDWHDGGSDGGGGEQEPRQRLHRTGSGMSRGSSHNRSSHSLHSAHTAASGGSFRQPASRQTRRVDVPALTLLAPPASPGRGSALDSTAVAPRTGASRGTASPGGFADEGRGATKAWGTPTGDRQRDSGHNSGRRRSVDAAPPTATGGGHTSQGGGKGPSGLKASSLVRQRRAQSATRTRHAHDSRRHRPQPSHRGQHSSRPPPSPQPTPRQGRHQWQPPQGSMRSAGVDADDMPSLVAGVRLATAAPGSARRQ